MHSIFSKLNDIHFYRCCKCNKTVDKISVSYDPCDMNRIITVYCHSEKETSNLSDYILYDSIDIIEARCFEQKNDRLEVKETTKKLGG